MSMVHVCVYMCICVYVHMFFVCVHMCCVWTHVLWVYVCVQIFVNMCMHVFMYVHI